MSHKKRIAINARQNELLKPLCARYCEWDGNCLVGTTMMPQSMHVWPGIELIGCPRGSGKQRVVQGVVYTVIDMNSQGITLKMLDDYCHGQDDETATVLWEEVCMSQFVLLHLSGPHH